MNTQPSIKQINAIAQEGIKGMQKNPNSYIDDGSGLGNCFVFTIAASESLEEAGIDHKLAYANDHATIVLPDNWMLDMYSPSIQQTLDGKLTLYQNQASGRQLGRLARMRVVADIALNPDKTGDPLDHYIWLRSPYDPFKPGSSARCADVHKEPTLVMALYAPELGRRALRAYGTFVQNNKYNDVTAAEGVIGVKGLFPEVDMRTPIPLAITKLVKRLAGKQHIELATQVADAFFTGLNPAHDSRISEYRADCLRNIGRFSDDPLLVQHAKALYEQAVTQPYAWRKNIQHKIDICDTLLSDTIGD